MTYTSPEMVTERRICERLRAKILRNACAFCLHRDRDSPAGFETCSLFGRRFPLCNVDGRAFQFELDKETLPRALDEK